VAVFCQFYKWPPSQVRGCLVGDLDLLWRLVVYEKVDEGGD
jgi:hypothetical protein